MIRCRMKGVKGGGWVGGVVHLPGPGVLGVVVPSPEQRMFVSWWFADIANLASRAGFPGKGGSDGATRPNADLSMEKKRQLGS